MRHAVAALTLGALSHAFLQPHTLRRAVTLRKADELPEVSPGEVDWDEEFKRLKRGETGKAAKLNEVGLEVERTGRVAKQKGWGPRGAYYYQAGRDASPSRSSRCGGTRGRCCRAPTEIPSE